MGTRFIDPTGDLFTPFPVESSPIAERPSTIRWALVPEMPNALIPAVGCRPDAGGQAVSSAVNPNGKLSPFDVRVGILEMQMLRDHTMPHGKKHFDQARDTRGSLEMTDVRLDGAEQ